MQISRKYKTLPIQPDSAPSDLNQASNAGNAVKRAKRHAKYENSRNPDQTKTDGSNRLGDERTQDLYISLVQKHGLGYALVV
jgi:hypothetical protein